MKGKLRHIVNISLAALLAAGTSACSDDSDKSTPLTSKFFAETPDIFVNSVPEVGRGVTATDEGGSFRFVYDNDRATADIYITDIDLGEGRDSYTCRDVNWTFSIGTPTTERVVTDDVLVATDAAGNQLTLTDVTMIYYEANELDPDRCRGVTIDFRTGGRRYTVYPRRLCCKGTTLAVGDDGTHAILYSPALSVDFRPEQGSADVAIVNFSLDDDGSGTVAQLPGAKLVLTPGGYTLTAPAVTVADSVVIDDFSAEATMGGKLKVSYRAVTPTRTVDVSSTLLPNRFDTPTAQSAP